MTRHLQQGYKAYFLFGALRQVLSVVGGVAGVVTGFTGVAGGTPLNRGPGAFTDSTCGRALCCAIGSPWNATHYR